MRIHDFVRQHIIPVNAVIALSITVAAVLDFLAPQAPYLAWLSYVLAVLVLLLMLLEVLARRQGVQAGSWYVVLLSRLRTPPGPLWRSPAWQMIGIVVLIALLLGKVSSAHAERGGVIASIAPNIRNVQVLLLDLRENTQRIRETLTVVNTKVDSIKESVGKLEAALPSSKKYDSPRDALKQGDYLYLREYVGNGNSLPIVEQQGRNDLVLGLSKKRPDRFKLLELYQRYDMNKANLIVLAYPNIAIDDTTARNVEKLNAWGEKNLNKAGDNKSIFRDCHTNLLDYAYIAGDQDLADWLIKNKGLDPGEMRGCGFTPVDVSKWDGKSVDTLWQEECKISAKDIRVIVSL